MMIGRTATIPKRSERVVWSASELRWWSHVVALSLLGCTCAPNTSRASRRTLPSLTASAAVAVSAPHASAPPAERDTLCSPLEDEQEVTLCHVAHSLDRGDAKSVVAGFDASLRPLLTAARLGEAWSEETSGLGRLIQVRPLSSSQARRGWRIQLVLRFERGERLVEGLIRASGEVASLSFGSAPREWIPPGYVRLASFDEHDVTIGRPPVLPGRLTLPRTARKAPAVLIIQGSGPLDEDCSSHPSGLGNKLCKDLAWGLSSNDIVVLRYQKRSFVDTRPLPDFESEVIRDACEAQQLLASRPEVDATRIALVGHSLGGALAPRIARSCGGFSSLVLLSSPARPMLDVLSGQVAYLGWHSGNPELTSKRVGTLHDKVQEVLAPAGAPGEELELLGSTAPRSYWRDLLKLQPTLDVAAVSLPILVVQGERDYQVGLADYDRWRNALAGRKNARFKRFPRLDHTLATGTGTSTHYDYYRASHVDEAVIDLLARWITE